MATLFLSYDLKLNLSWKTAITQVKLIGDNNFRISWGYQIQSWSVFTDHSKIFILQQIWKLLWLVCTLKYTQATNQNDETHNSFSFWGPFCEPTFKQMSKYFIYENILVETNQKAH